MLCPFFASMNDDVTEKQCSRRIVQAFAVQAFADRRQLFDSAALKAINCVSCRHYLVEAPSMKK
jgi:hypothetical protein